MIRVEKFGLLSTMHWILEVQYCIAAGYRESCSAATQYMQSRA